MAVGISDRVREQASGFLGGTGAVTLTATAVPGFQSFLSGWGASGTGPYVLVLGSQWETGYGTINAGGTTLTRTTPKNGSSGAGVAVNFAAGTLDCFSDASAYLLQFLASAALHKYGFSQLTIVPQGRLTLASLTPVMTSSQSAKTTIYYTAYQGRLIPLFDGTRFAPVDFGQEISQATTDATKSPAAVAANKNYDLFVWDDAGTIRLSRGPAWSSDTVRGAGAGTSELSDIAFGSVHGGIQLNANAITNGPAAFRGTYVGTVRSDGSSQINFTFGAAASGGTAGVLGVWNAFNRVSVSTTVVDSGASYTYTSSTIRQARASASNQISMICGISEDGASAIAMGDNLTVAAGAATACTGVGVNSTTTFAFQKMIVAAATAAQTRAAGASGGTFTPALGWNTVSLNENSDGTNANNFDAGSGQSLSCMFRM
jgi:hypothetical protein